ncbi:hypothetical protein [Parafrankia sp. BMG5.11]|uniref:hypothetical protein n=1 Tax=Parafrankia sp. BMG5.11 TaxID=222540 RepID=UPI00103D464C|nr:hypothetical protein [Parafrankia sp. BMG5.11]
MTVIVCSLADAGTARLAARAAISRFLMVTVPLQDELTSGFSDPFIIPLAGRLLSASAAVAATLRLKCRETIL